MTSPGTQSLGTPGLKLTWGDVMRWAHNNVTHDMPVTNANGEYLNDLDVWGAEDGGTDPATFVMTFQPGP